jgi:hypothetical protein
VNSIKAGSGSLNLQVNTTLDEDNEELESINVDGLQLKGAAN